MKNLRALRTARGLTQIALQMATGIDQALLSKYENGERTPTLENLITLADYFHTSLDHLAGRTSQSLPYPP